MTIGERIKAQRKMLGLSAEEVARRMNVSPATVYRYESAGIMNMGIDKLEAIANALNISPAYLMGWTDEYQKNEVALENIGAKKQEVLSLLVQLNDEELKQVLDYTRFLCSRQESEK